MVPLTNKPWRRPETWSALAVLLFAAIGAFEAQSAWSSSRELTTLRSHVRGELEPAGDHSDVGLIHGWRWAAVHDARTSADCDRMGSAVQLEGCRSYLVAQGYLPAAQ